MNLQILARALPLMAVVFLVSGVSIGLTAERNRPDTPLALAYGTKLREMKTLESRRTAELLKARSGTVLHYDNMARIEVGLRQVEPTLRHYPAFLSGEERGRLSALLSDWTRLRSESERLIEHFKSENAILRNSVRFLSMFAIDAESETLEERGAGEALDGLIRDVLLLQVDRSSRTIERAKQSIEKLENAASSLDDSGENIDLILRHAALVVTKSQRVESLNANLDALPLDARSSQLLSTWRAAERRAQVHAEQTRVVLFASALLTFTLAALYVFVRMRHSAAELKKSSALLEAANASLRIEKDKQKELSELKSRFVSMTSHEFRTPLSLVVSSSEMLTAYGESWTEEKKTSHLQRIKASALSMTKMLDNILLIGKGDAGMLTLNTEPVCFETLVHEVVEAVEQTMNARGRVKVESESEVGLYLDENLLRHILENLVSNALKYSDAPDEVRVRFFASEGGLNLSVKDHGIGIPADDLEHLFESFRRGSNVGKRSGTGLGLSIVHRAVNLHGGELSVDSKVGKGTLFSIYIPAEKAEEWLAS